MRAGLLAEGADRTPAGYLIPAYRPLSLAEMAGSAQLWRSHRDAAGGPAAADPRRRWRAR
jgi:hypothetical protein